MRPAVGLVLVLAASAACSYDWDTGPGAGEAGAQDATGGEAAVDATGSDVDVEVDTGLDAGVDAEAPFDAPADVPAEVSYCASLESQVAIAKANALDCAGNLPCNSSVSDQCGCIVWVAQASGVATSTYVNDVKELDDSGCALGCGGCGIPFSGAFCLPNANGDGGVVCTPHQ